MNTTLDVRSLLLATPVPCAVPCHMQPAPCSERALPVPQHVRKHSAPMIDNQPAKRNKSAELTVHLWR